MRHLLVAVIAAVLAFSVAVEADQYIIKGVGAQSCGRWLSDRKGSDYQAIGALTKPNFALFRAQGIDIACRSGIGLSTRWG